MKPHELTEYLQKKYPQILFREGTDHSQFSVNGGMSWDPLPAARHALQDIKKSLLGAINRQIKEQLRLINTQARRNTLSFDPKQWAEEVKHLNLIPAPKIHEPIEQGTYTGVVKHIDENDRFFVQKIGEKSLAIHDARKFPDGLPDKGNAVRVNYRDGVAKVNPVENSQTEEQS